MPSIDPSALAPGVDPYEDFDHTVQLLGALAVPADLPDADEQFVAVAGAAVADLA
ncbi:hypothetical protein [Streptomyces lasiicapitis]|uniref:hypothetical protein n=1 Tax=Streptomyces lasiicapitis TaxID=1923961 RepID=UPI00369AFE2F